MIRTKYLLQIFDPMLIQDYSEDGCDSVESYDYPQPTQYFIVPPPPVITSTTSAADRERFEYLNKSEAVRDAENDAFLKGYGL